MKSYVSTVILLINILIILLTIVDRSQSVDQSLFKRCAQSNFCSRMRAQREGVSNFFIEFSSIRFDAYSVTAEIVNSAQSQRFTFLLQPLVGETFRFQINEKNPRTTRYVVVDALKSEPSLAVFTNPIFTADNLTISSGNNKAVIYYKPLKIEFYNSDHLTITVNQKGLLNFEPLRARPISIPDNEKILWEEPFQSGDLKWVETKPKGPEAVALDFTYNDAQVLFGIPEHADAFSLRITTTNPNQDPYRLFNLDVPFHDTSSTMALYGSVPILYGHGPQRTAGIYWQNAADTWVDIYPHPQNAANAQAARFISESGIIDVFVLLGTDPSKVFQHYTDLTGVAPLPQLYLLGYHQCRWNYDNQTDLLNVNEGFNINDIPMDTLWLDIEYTYKKWYFTWDKVAFPNPLAMIKTLTDNGRHLNIIIDIHIAKNDSYRVYNECLEKDLFTKNKDGDNYVGACWPGPSSYPDLLNKAARDYLAEQYQLKNFPDTTDEVMIWNDMNEPSAFDEPEKTFPKDNIHFGEWEHRDIHNIFGHYQVMSTFDGLLKRGNYNKRPFILTRAHFAGSQRYAAVWTGDNTASWEFLRASIQMCLSQAVSGISFCGADVGGFFNNPSNELFERWYQTASFQPFFRSHANQDQPRREPWIRGEETMGVIRGAIRKRYAYLPFWYTLFYEHEKTGLPIMRPLLTHYPKDLGSYKIDNEYLLSDILLVRPVDQEKVLKVNVYFPSKQSSPGDIWYDVDTYKAYNQTGYVEIDVDRNKIPVYQRGGTIVPKKDYLRKSSVYMKDDPYTLIVCLDHNGEAAGTLYTDDEKSYDYRNGQYIYQRIEFSNGILAPVASQSVNNYDTKSNIQNIVIAGLNTMPKTVKLLSNMDERQLHFVVESNSLIIHDVNTSIRSPWTIRLSSVSSAYFVNSSLILIISIILLLWI